MLIHANSYENSFSLSIAGLGVIVRCNDPKHVKALQGRYQDFPLKNNPRLSLEVTLSGQDRASALLDTGTVLRRDGVYFKAPGYQGHILPGPGTGKLTLSSMYPEEDIDYFIRVAYTVLAFRGGGVMLHAAGIVRDGLAYLFIGHSGAGKTTVARLSTQYTVLNDDLVILLPGRTAWQVHGTPFWNISQVKPAAQSAPLGGLFSLEQAKRIHLEPLRVSKAVAELVANLPILSIDRWRSADLLERLYQITLTTPVEKLYFQPDAAFWNLIVPQPG